MLSVPRFPVPLGVGARMLAVASLLGVAVACSRGSKDDDSGDPGTGTGAATGTGGPGTGSGDATGTGTGGGPGTGSGGGTGSGTGTGGGTGTGATGTGTGSTGGPCGRPTELGPWGGDFPHPLYGATITSDPYPNDAGLDDVLAAYENGDYDLSGSPITVTGAHIINVGFQPDQRALWLEDANAAINTYLPEQITIPVAPGDSVSFEVVEVGDYFGQPQITGIQNLSMEAPGGAVRIQSGIGLALDWDAMGPRNFEVYGEVVDDLGACLGGSKNCYNLEHGGVKTQFSADPANRTFYPGDCVHIIAPLTVSDGLALYALTNWDWWTYIR